MDGCSDRDSINHGKYMFAGHLKTLSRGGSKDSSGISVIKVISQGQVCLLLLYAQRSDYRRFLPSNLLLQSNIVIYSMYLTLWPYMIKMKGAKSLMSFRDHIFVMTAPARANLYTHSSEKIPPSPPCY